MLSRFCLVTSLVLVAFHTANGQDRATRALQYRTEIGLQYRDGNDPQIQSMCRLDLHYPVGQTDYATVVWFHGGGLTGGTRKLPETLRRRGIAVATADYRLSPDVQSPMCIRDAAAAVAWVIKNIDRYGGSSSKVVVSGHSAGGYLTSMIGFDKSYLEAFDVDADDLAGLAPLSGHTITHFTVRQELGIDGKQPIIDAMAPLFHVRRLPVPVLLVTGDREKEMLGRYEENAYFYRMLKVVGNEDITLHELDGFDHGGMGKPGIELVIDFVKDVTRDESAAE